MLLYCASKPILFLASNGRKHPEHEEIEVPLCPVCKHKLYGHGWRLRNLYHGDEWIIIWVHRCLCPECSKTFTVLPAEASAFEAYGLEVIIRVLKAIEARGRLDYSKKAPVPINVKKHWWKNFTRRRRTLPPDAGFEESLRSLLPSPASKKNILCLEYSRKPVPVGFVNDRPTILLWMCSPPDFLILGV